MIERNWNELIRPEKPQIESGADGVRKARIVAEPLERGFGVTLGNSLRRVLLSSLQGAAVTAIQIDGVVHEFSPLEGVREDVVDIVLNIKQLALRMHADGPKRMTLRATGPGAVTASQIEAPSDIEILNGDHVLLTLDDGRLGAHRVHRADRQGLRAGRAQPPGRRADRPDLGRRGLFAGAPRRLPRRADPPGPEPRLRQAGDGSGDQRRGDAGRRRRLRRAHPAGPAAGVHHLRGAEEEARGRGQARAAVQPGAAEEGRRAGARRSARPTA